ncbi:MAG: cobalamin biosynthesis protein CobW [Rhodobacteraceae bacterium]|nr:cobalamin biosynthesis protein CobW [Paracoccaceae bacterium]
MTKRIPATVVTGFLGAGKTTLIRHMLRNAGGRRIALIINEFGDLGVDGSILNGCGVEGCDEYGIVELSNGCICCAVADEFAPAMLSLLDLPTPPDHIVIETSGLALPQPLVRAFNWPELRTRVTVDGVVAVIDGPAVREGLFAHNQEAVEEQRRADANLDHDTPLAELYEDQLACADLVIINKVDLLLAGELAGLTDAVTAQARAGVSILTASEGAVNPQILLGIDAAAETNLSGRSEIHHGHEGDDAPHHDHDDFESFVVSLPEVVDSTRFTEGIRQAMLRHDLIRVKGFACVSGKPMRFVVQAVGRRVNSYFDIPFGKDEVRRSRLVVIGLTGIDRTAVESSLNAAAGG